MPLPVCTRRTVVCDRRILLTVFAMLLTAVAVIAMVSIGPWTDLSDSEGETKNWSGSGTSSDPWKFGDSNEFEAVINDGTLTITCVGTTGSATIPTFVDDSGANYGPWTPSAGEERTVTKIVIQKGISGIENGYGTFSGMSDLKTIDLGASGITTIPQGCFQFSNNLETLIFPSVESVTVEMYGLGVELWDEEGNVLWKDDMSSHSFAGGTFRYDASKTAQWILSAKVLVRQPMVQSHSVTYELGDGVTGEAPKSSSVAEGVEFEFAQCDATKEGFVFAGWNYLGDTHPAGYKMTMGNENIVLTAVWKAEAKEFTVTFYPNGGDWSEPRVEHRLSGELIDLGTITPPTRDSYTFDGWSCGDRTYSSEETVLVLSDMEFTAQWEAEGGSDPITPVVPGPIFPGDEQEAIEIITDDGKDGSKDDKKTVLVIGIVVAIIAILAVMSVSKRE